MKDHYDSRDNRLQEREKAIKSVYFPSHGFCLFPSVKTCPITAPQRVFSSYLLSIYPLFKMLFRRYGQKGSFHQKRGNIKMRSFRAYKKPGKYKVEPFLQISAKEVKRHNETIKKADGYDGQLSASLQVDHISTATTTGFFILKKRRRMFMSRIAARGNIIPSAIVMDFQLTIDSKLPL